MKKRREQVRDLFFDGMKDAMKKLPVWVKILVPILWLLLYVTLILVVGYLALAYKNVLLGVFDVGFLFIVIIMVIAAVSYHNK